MMDSQMDLFLSRKRRKVTHAPEKDGEAPVS